MMNNDALLRYAEDNSSPEPEILQALSRDTHLRMLHPRMLTGHLQGRLLAMISRMIRSRYILEIGTFTGYSALCLAEGLADNGVLHTIEINPEFEDNIRHWFDQAGASEKIKLHIGNAMELIADLVASVPFDLVYLDADKEHYPDYYTLLRESLRPGSFILADNVLWDGKVLHPAEPSDRDTLGIQEFNRLVAEDAGVEKVLLPIRDGLTLVRICN
ncbi:MAG: O-methyltransferase [Bacteroidales bacterium]